MQSSLENYIKNLSVQLTLQKTVSLNISKQFSVLTKNKNISFSNIDFPTPYLPMYFHHRPGSRRHTLSQLLTDFTIVLRGWNMHGAEDDETELERRLA